MHKPLFSLNTVDRNRDLQQNVNIRHGGVASLPPKEQSNPVVPPAVVASGPYLLHTKEHGPDCKGCAIVRNEVMLPAADFACLRFEQAAIQWLEEKAVTKEPGTIRAYQDYINRLKPFFADMPLTRLQQDPWLLNSYQRQQKPIYHAASVNHDCNTLLQILQRAGLREEIEKHYEPLKVPDWQPPKVLSEKEEAAFFEIAATRRAWQMAYWVASLTNNTTASGKELRMLQLKDINLHADPPMFSVPRNMKNKYRQRGIPLNEHGVLFMERLLFRAREMGSIQPEHYLFPFRDRMSKRYEPGKPASAWWIYYQWNNMVKAAMDKGAISFKVKPHNLRHQVITRMLEEGHPEEVVREIAGHVSREMMLHYSHTRMGRKAAVLNSLVRQKKTAASVVISKSGKAEA